MNIEYKECSVKQRPGFVKGEKSLMRNAAEYVVEKSGGPGH